MASLQTNNPSPAATGSLTFAKDLNGTNNIIDARQKYIEQVKKSYQNT